MCSLLFFVPCWKCHMNVSGLTCYVCQTADYFKEPSIARSRLVRLSSATTQKRTQYSLAAQFGSLSAIRCKKYHPIHYNVGRTPHAPHPHHRARFKLGMTFFSWCQYATSVTSRGTNLWTPKNRSVTVGSSITHDTCFVGNF